MSNKLSVVEKQSVQPQNMGIITPAGSIDDALNQFRLYQEMKNKLGDKNTDFLIITNRSTGEVKHHPKKSFVRKVQRFFNLSCEIIQDEPLYDRGGKIIAWLAKARAIHSGTGAFQEGDGSCSFDEKVDRYGNPIKAQQTIHNIRAHAITRAKNRAILDLVGFGEVSAEEINNLPEPSQPKGYDNASSVDRPASDKQIKKFIFEADKRGLSEKWQKALIDYMYKKQSRKDLTGKEASDLIKMMMEATNEEMNEVFKAIKAHHQAVKESSSRVIDVDPETGEVKQPNTGPLTNEEIDKALGL